MCSFVHSSHPAFFISYSDIWTMHACLPLCLLLREVGLISLSVFNCPKNTAISFSFSFYATFSFCWGCSKMDVHLKRGTEKNSVKKKKQAEVKRVPHQFGIEDRPIHWNWLLPFSLNLQMVSKQDKQALQPRESSYTAGFLVAQHCRDFSKTQGYLYAFFFCTCIGKGHFI